MTTSTPDWEFIPLSKYKSPPEPATQTLRNSLSDIAQRLRVPGFLDWRSDEAEPEPELESIPHYLVEQAAPEPDWDAIHHDMLATALQSWLDADDDEAGIRILVTAPYSQLGQSAATFGDERGWRTIEPPTPAQILGNDASWLEQWSNHSEQHSEHHSEQHSNRWVVPALERCYLRHHNGLNLLRGWLNAMASGPPGVVVCDSWAWAFLSKTLKLDQIFPSAHTVAPLGAAALDGWFRQLADQEGRTKFNFRQADSGQVVCDHSDEETENKVDFLKHLAARSRGIPQLAWNIWRHSLQVEIDDAVKEKAEEKASSDIGQTLWVRPWEKVELPTVPSRAKIEEAFVLHALLLHDGLPDQLLPQLLPLMPFEIASSIQRLQRANLLGGDGTCRRVTSLGYPDVRDFLRGEGFLTDDL